MNTRSFLLAAGFGLAAAFMVSCSEKCGENKYDPEKQFCADSAIYDKCGGEEYNPAEKICIDDKITLRCGDKGYDSAAQFCSGDELYEKCKGEEYNPESLFCDFRDSKLYKRVKINNQIWMAENLNYEADSSKCYGEGGSVCTSYDSDWGLCDKSIKLSNEAIQANCAKYGRLYSGKSAMKACPEGWHLPNNAEWKELMDFLASDKKEVEYKKNTWFSEDLGGGPAIKIEDEYYLNAGKYLKAISHKGTDEYGFTALLGGYFDGSYYDGLDKYGQWLSKDGNWRMMYEYNNVDFGNGPQIGGIRSIRCLKD